MSDSYLTYILEDCLGHIEGITSRAMFGGYGIYKDGLIFAIIAEDQIYFKVGDSNKADYEAINSQPFVYEQGNHKKTTMSYYEIPEEILTNPEEVEQWVAKAWEVSQAKRKV